MSERRGYGVIKPPCLRGGCYKATFNNISVMFSFIVGGSQIPPPIKLTAMI